MSNIRDAPCIDDLDLKQLISTLVFVAHSVIENSENNSSSSSLPPLTSKLRPILQSLNKRNGEKHDDSQYGTLEDPSLWNECAGSCDLLLDQIAEDGKSNDKDDTNVILMLQQISVTSRSNAESQWRRLLEFLMADLPKCQTVYPHLMSPTLNNDRLTPFVPTVHPGKPFGTVPFPLVDINHVQNSKGNQISKNLQPNLQIKLQPGHGLESSKYNTQDMGNFLQAPTEHCPNLYEKEIQSFQYTENQMKLQNPNVLNAPLPCVSRSPCVWLNTVHGLEKFVEMMRNENVSDLAFRIENHSYRSFTGFICLIGFTVRKGDGSSNVYNNYLVDTLVINRCEINRLLAPIFANPLIVKICHGAHNDIAWLQRDFGIYLVNLFDTSKAAQALSFPSTMYKYVMSRYCTDFKSFEKSYRLADWRQRPVSSNLQQFTIWHSYYLLYIYDCVKVELFEKAGVGMIQRVLDDCRQICLIRYSPQPFHSLGYKLLIRNTNHAKSRVLHKRNISTNKARPTLSYRELCVLSDLWDWRDKTARKYDESIHYVCNNEALLRLAVECPTTLPKVRSILLHLPASTILRYSHDLLSCIKHATERATEEHLRPQRIKNIDVVGKGPEARAVFVTTDINGSSTINTRLSTTVGLAPSSAFFKPTYASEKLPSRESGMMSPVLGTEALYKEAGWMTAQEQNSTNNNNFCHDTVNITTESPITPHKSIDYINTKSAETSPSNLYVFDKNLPKCNVESARFKEDIRDTSLFRNLGAHEDAPNIGNHDVQGIVQGSPVKEKLLEDDDDADFDGNTNNSFDNILSRDSNSENYFAVPTSFREIYRISNRNRFIKKTGSPPPESGVTVTTDKEVEEFLAAGALMRDRGFTNDKAYAYLFEDTSAGQQVSSERDSEESSPDPTANAFSKEDDLAFMKEIGWVQYDEELEILLNPDRDGRNESISGGESKEDPFQQRKATNRLAHFGSQGGRCSSVSNEYYCDSPSLGISQRNSPLILGATTGRTTPAATDQVKVELPPSPLSAPSCCFSSSRLCLRGGFVPN